MRKTQNTADRRVRRTQKAIWESFFTLLKKKPVGEMTISELCDLADINRSTFYMYYSSPMDLLEQIAQEIFAVDLREEDSPRDTLHKICEKVYESRDYGKLLFGPHGSVSFLRRQLVIIRDRMAQDVRRRVPEADPNRVTYLFTFFYQGALGVLERWIQNEFQESPDEIADLVNEISDVLLASFP